jgi:hypothetical protein
MPALPQTAGGRVLTQDSSHTGYHPIHQDQLDQAGGSKIRGEPAANRESTFIGRRSLLENATQMPEG